MAALPTSARLGPFEYRISDKRADWKRLKIDPDTHWGYTHHDTSTILLNPKMPDTLRRVTLLHELLHAGAFSGGVHDGRKRTEEEWVSLAAPRLLDCMDRSPDVARFLFGQRPRFIDGTDIIDSLFETDQGYAE